jgi:hypothetical protein
MLKKMAAGGGKKKGGDKKGGAKGGAKAPAPAPKAAEKPVEEVVDKETRKKMDTAQVLSYCDKIQAVKAIHVQAVWTILRTVNQIKEVNLLNY